MHRPRASVRLLLAAAACLALAGAPRPAGAFTWAACDADAAPFKPSDVLLTPDPAVIGGTVTFAIKAAADRAVAAGAIGMDVAFAGVPIYEGSDDLCAKTACPIAPGPVEINYVQELPPIAPPGDYDVTLRARDATGTELLCVTVHFTMVPPPSNGFAAAAAAALRGVANTAGFLGSGGRSSGGGGGGGGVQLPVGQSGFAGEERRRVAPSRRMLSA